MVAAHIPWLIVSRAADVAFFRIDVEAANTTFDRTQEGSRKHLSSWIPRPHVFGQLSTAHLLVRTKGIDRDEPRI